MKPPLHSLFVIIAWFYTQHAHAQNEGGTTSRQVVSSPDGHIRFSVFTAGGLLRYAVDYNNAPVIEPSRLGMVVNGRVLGEGASLGKVELYKLNESYAYRGVHSIAVNKWFDKK